MQADLFEQVNILLRYFAQLFGVLGVGGNGRQYRLEVLQQRVVLFHRGLLSRYRYLSRGRCTGSLRTGSGSGMKCIVASESQAVNVRSEGSLVLFNRIESVA
ncbi:hypothetical protein WH50_19865 [Pokkaliibacter plantistimulans]|uniref:Uncharacterized protein n=1 Tax=Pokkaliibacter plantistimulans TaxID=1635171 RepID=A0ABX5LSG9_9GAMM|nr:hypothetical protein WH50_19865 [Pokkaliibacter plantistimulans]